MKPLSLGRRAVAIAVLAVLLVPAAGAAAADVAPAGPPATVVEWQAHLAHMRAMPGPLGDRITECVEHHGSMAGLLGPFGSMTEMMGGSMTEMMGGTMR